jgi:integrase
MASIWKDPRSPYWLACFTGYVGVRAQQLKRSTATTNKKLARRLADELEEAARGKRTTERIKEFLENDEDLKADLKAKRAAHHAFDFALRHTTGSGLGSKSARGFITHWLTRTKSEVSPATWAKYDQTVRLFLTFLEGKAEQDLSTIRQDDIARFRDEQAQRVARSTANVMLKIVRIFFTAAEADGVIIRNEARHVKKLKVKNEQSSRRAFTLPELKNILAQCDDEWRSLILFGFYTGQRLGDLAALTWQNLDLEQKELRLSSRKTGRVVVIPLAAPLLRHVEQLPAGDDPKQPLHPRASELVAKHGRAGALSNQFGNILAAAGLTETRTHKVEDEDERKGRAARRVVSEISFHSLRHTNVSLLKNAGVSDAVAQDLVGHESAEVSRLYTHIEDKAKREAVNKLPVIGEGRAAV